MPTDCRSPGDHPALQFPNVLRVVLGGHNVRILLEAIVMINSRIYAVGTSSSHDRLYKLLVGKWNIAYARPKHGAWHPTWCAEWFTIELECQSPTRASP